MQTAERIWINGNYDNSCTEDSEVNFRASTCTEATAPEQPAIGQKLDFGIADIKDGLRSCQLLSNKYQELATSFYSNLSGCKDSSGRPLIEPPRAPHSSRATEEQLHNEASPAWAHGFPASYHIQCSDSSDSEDSEIWGSPTAVFSPKPLPALQAELAELYAAPAASYASPVTDAISVLTESASKQRLVHLLDDRPMQALHVLHAPVVPGAPAPLYPFTSNWNATTLAYLATCAKLALLLALIGFTWQSTTQFAGSCMTPAGLWSSTSSIFTQQYQQPWSLAGAAGIVREMGAAPAAKAGILWAAQQPAREAASPAPAPSPSATLPTAACQASAASSPIAEAKQDPVPQHQPGSLWAMWATWAKEAIIAKVVKAARASLSREVAPPVKVAALAAPPAVATATPVASAEPSPSRAYELLLAMRKFAYQSIAMIGTQYAITPQGLSSSKFICPAVDQLLGSLAGIKATPDAAPSEQPLPSSANAPASSSRAEAAPVDTTAEQAAGNQLNQPDSLWATWAEATKSVKAAIASAQPDTLALLLAVRDFAWQSEVMVVWYIACRMVPAIARLTREEDDLDGLEYLEASYLAYAGVVLEQVDENGTPTAIPGSPTRAPPLTSDDEGALATDPEPGAVPGFSASLQAALRSGRRLASSVARVARAVSGSQKPGSKDDQAGCAGSKGTLGTQALGAAVPRDPTEIVDNITAKQTRGEMQASGSGGFGFRSDPEEEELELRRLGFVPQCISKASGYSTSFYSQAKAFVPETLRPQLVSWEQFASKHGQSVAINANKLADRGREVLQVADRQIDGAINKGVSFYHSSTKELQNLAQRNQIGRQFATTRHSVVKRFQDLINLGARLKAGELYKEGLSYARKVATVAQEKSQAMLGHARDKSKQAHDTLVRRVQPLYKKAYDSCNNLLGAAQDVLRRHHRLQADRPAL